MPDPRSAFHSATLSTESNADLILLVNKDLQYHIDTMSKSKIMLEMTVAGRS